MPKNACRFARCQFWSAHFPAGAHRISAKSLVPVCMCGGAQADDEPAGAALCGNNGHECNAPPIFTPAAGLHHSTDKMLHRLLLVWPSFHKQLARRYFHMLTYSSSRCFTFCLCSVSAPARGERTHFSQKHSRLTDWLLLSAAANYNKSDARGEQRTPPTQLPRVYTQRAILFALIGKTTLCIRRRRLLKRN
jgi:hypothetical protein